jgi:iron(III) transport system substrate-binding protein
LAVALAALTVSLLAACGDDDDDTAAPPSTAATTETSGATSSSNASASNATTASDGSTTSGGGVASTTPATSSGAWAQVLDAAKSQGSVTVYSTAAPDVNTAVQDAFNKAYPEITANVVRLPTPQGEQRVDAEHAGNTAGADVLIVADVAYATQHANDGYFVPLDGPDIAALAANSRGPNNNYFIAASAPWGLAWNTDSVQGTPTMSDLLDPKYKGRAGLPEYQGMNNVMAVLATVADEYQRETGQGDFLDKLGAQQPQFFPSTPNMAQSIGSGELEVSVLMPLGAVPSGIPVKVDFPQKVAGLPLNAQVVASGKNHEAGQVFANWLATKDGQTAFAKGQIAALPGIEGAVDITQDRVINVNTGDHDQAFYTSYEAQLDQTFKR